jgi:hypothetical protein
MPPIATNEKDHEAVQLLADWIVNTLPSRQTYDAWRLGYFGDLVSPQGERGADPDGDGNSNESEFYKFSNPTNSFDFYIPVIAANDSQVILQLPNFPGRRVTVETSTDLRIPDSWSLWPVQGNNGIPPAAGLTNTLVAPLDDPMRFFKIRVQEE